MRSGVVARWLIASLLIAGLTGGIAWGGVAAALAQADLDVATMADQVAQVRGLTLKTTPTVTTLDRTAMVTRLSRPLNTPEAIREFLTSQMLLEVLGATPQGFDLRQLQIDLLSEQLLALYDHGDHAIYLVSDAGSGPTERLTLAHELTHAIQDQSFDLGRMLPEHPVNGDVGMAAQALVEGDAMVTMRVWGRQFLRPDEKRSLGNDTTPSDPVMDAAPAFVRGELTFPYDAGWIFAQLLYQDGGFDAINQAFADPPRSTEQILHPEKYAAREPPITVSISPLENVLGGTWVTRRTDVFGELVLRLLLEPRVGYPTAEAAATGWGGDAYTILEDGDSRRIVAFVTAWDTPNDAAEFYNAYGSAITSQYPDVATPLINEPSRLRWAVPGYQLQLLETGNSVRFVYAPDAFTLEAIDAQLSAADVSSSTQVTAPPVRTPATSPGGPGGTPTVTVTPTVAPTPGAASGPAFLPPDDSVAPSAPAPTPTVTATPSPGPSNDNSE